MYRKGLTWIAMIIFIAILNTLLKLMLRNKPESGSSKKMVMRFNGQVYPNSTKIAPELKKLGFQ